MTARWTGSLFVSREWLLRNRQHRTPKTTRSRTKACPPIRSRSTPSRHHRCATCRICRRCQDISLDGAKVRSRHSWRHVHRLRRDDLHCWRHRLEVRLRAVPASPRHRLLTRPDADHHRWRGTLHLKQSHRRGLGRPASDEASPAPQMTSGISGLRQYRRRPNSAVGGTQESPGSGGGALFSGRLSTASP